MLKSTIFGIDLAKNVIQVCQVSKHGELVSNKAVSRQKLKEIQAKAKPSVVAIEAVVVIIGVDMQRTLTMMFESLALKK